MKYKSFSYFFYLIFVLTFLNIEAYSNYNSFSLGSTLTGGLMLGSWIIDTVSARKIKIKGFAFLSLAIFVAYICLNVFWSVNLELSILFLNRFFLCFIFFIISFDLLDDIERIIKAINFYTISIFILCLGAGYNVVNKIPFEGTVDRFTVNGIDPNDFGIILLSGLILNVFPLLYEKSRIRIIKFISIATIFSILILATSSRAVFLGLLLVCSILLFKFLKTKPIYSFIVIPVIGCFLPYALSFVPERSFERLAGQSVLEDGGSGRSDIWLQVIELSSDRFLFGYGFNTLRHAIGWEAHNTFLSILFGGGFVGLLIWLSVWFFILYTIFLIKNSNYRIIFLCIFFVLLIGNLTLNWEVRKTMYFIFAILLKLQSILIKR